MKGVKTPAFVMGDFNDEPFDTSLAIHALSTRQRQRVVDADNPLFWNLSWNVIGHPADGSFYYNNEPNLLDQFLVNKNMAKEGSPIRAKPDTLQILRFPGTFVGKYKRPKPFGGMGKPVDENGFSDHFQSACRSSRPTERPRSVRGTMKREVWVEVALAECDQPLAISVQASFTPGAALPNGEDRRARTERPFGH